MALPHVPEARVYYQSALQRLDDARLLLDGDRTTSAVYLAGYSVECILKALLLSRLTPGRRRKMLESFRGAKAHDFEWLKKRYFDAGGSPPPPTIVKSFLLVAAWATDLRYRAGAIRLRDAEKFLQATEEILHWADERL
jgi:HEPN domain-containing protein